MGQLTGHAHAESKQHLQVAVSHDLKMLLSIPQTPYVSIIILAAMRVAAL